MNEQPDNWTTWIISTIMAALSTMVATVVFLARMIESKYTTEIRDLKLELKEYKVYADNDRHELLVKSEECQKDRYSLAIRVAQLERKVEL